MIWINIQIFITHQFMNNLLIIRFIRNRIPINRFIVICFSINVFIKLIMIEIFFMLIFINIIWHKLVLFIFFLVIYCANIFLLIWFRFPVGKCTALWSLIRQSITQIVFQFECTVFFHSFVVKTYITFHFIKTLLFLYIFKVMWLA